MNFVALIGIVSEIYIQDQSIHYVEFKVEKEQMNDNEWYEIIPVIIDSNKIDSFDNLKIGDIVGIKGKITSQNDKIYIDALRVKNFND